MQVPCPACRKVHDFKQLLPLREKGNLTYTHIAMCDESNVPVYFTQGVAYIEGDVTIDSKGRIQKAAEKGFNEG